MNPITLLSIDTATEYAGVCISKQGEVLCKRESNDPKNHGAFLQPAIQEIVQESGISLNSIDAVAVAYGPGSYTGLRVGLASAKGVCFALNKPLICIGTLAVIANAAKAHFAEAVSDCLIYPMIDARRMEVFSAIYNQNLEAVQAPKPMILKEDFLASLPDNKIYIFCGNGASKINRTNKQTNHWFDDKPHQIDQMVAPAEAAYQAKNFANLAYAEPLYTKDFHDTRKQ